MSQNRKFSAVIFDMDGLMFDTENVDRQAWQKSASELGYTISDDLYIKTIGHNIKDTESIFYEALGHQLPFDELHKRETIYFNDYINKYGIPIKKGLIELLNFLDELSLPKAVASSTIKSKVIQNLTNAKILDRFNVIVGGDEVKNGKPAPDIFLLASKKLNINPNLCLVLEDSDAGIKSAYLAGMTPVMIPDIKPPSKESISIAYKILPSLDDVRGLFEYGFNTYTH